MDFDAGLWGQVGVTGLPWLIVGWLVRRLFTGEVVTSRELERVERQRSEWREIALSAMGHTDSLVEVAETTKAALEALPPPPRPRSPSSEG